MNKFCRWPRVENSYQQKFIDRFLSEFPELEDETFVITEKLHGSNLQVFFEPNKPWKIGKRTAFLAEGEKFFDVQKVLPEYENVFRWFQWRSKMFHSPRRLFGELIGPGIQKGVNYGDKKKIRFFGYMSGDYMEPYSNVMTAAMLHGFLKHLVPVVAFVEGLDNALGVATDFNSMLNPIDGNICEGVVIRPFYRNYISHNGSHFMLKKKNEKFMEKAKEKKPPSPGDPEVQRLNAEFKLHITDNRLQNVFSKHGEIKEPQQIGNYIRLMIADAKEDFAQEHGDAFNKLDRGEQGKVTNVGRVVADMLKGYL